jgi:hypothetical protein
MILGHYQNGLAAIVIGAIRHGAQSRHDEPCTQFGNISPRWRLFAALFLVIAATVPIQAMAQQWVKLPEKAQQVMIDGLQVKVVVRPEISFVDGPDNKIVANLRAYAGLDDLQDKAPALLRALAERKSDCGTRWSFPDLAPTTVHDGKLKVGGQVRVVQWACIGPLKTILASETADFVVALYPLNRESEIVAAAELEKFDVGAGLLRSLDADRELRGAISDLLNKAFGGEDTKFKFPPEVMSISPKFTNAGIRDTGGGKGELFIEARATIGAGDMARIMSLIAK